MRGIDVGTPRRPADREWIKVHVEIRWATMLLIGGRLEQVPVLLR